MAEQTVKVKDTKPVKVATARAKAVSMLQNCVKNRDLRRSQRSSRAPATAVRKKMGTEAAKSIIPSALLEPVSR